MLPTIIVPLLAPLVLFISAISASSILEKVERQLLKKQVPAYPTGVKTITSPNGVTIRYKQPEEQGVCETTPGVNSYSGYVDVDESTHMFFWFFEARNNPDTAPITLWLNGGPGSDSMIGLFEELGPCYVVENGTSVLNPYSWNEVSNLLFLSQPLGVGFSYDDVVVGYMNETTDLPVNATGANATGRFSDVDPYRTDTTALAAKGAWEVLQGFIENLPVLDATVKSRSFNLWTESYGGHYGPSFYRYFYEQNLLIQNGSLPGVELNMHTLGIINGIVSEYIQAPYYPEFAYRNTYGIEAINETMYKYAKMNWEFPGACRDSIEWCFQSDRTTPDGKSTCAQATAICRSLIEGVYYAASERGPYDIRALANATIPPDHWVAYLNTAAVQDALGVAVNYTSTSSEQVWIGFDYSGDFVYPDLLADLEAILGYGGEIVESGTKLRDMLTKVYAVKDYICNWFGGEALSLHVKYTNAAEFREAGYAPLIVDGVEYGESRQYGNFSFTRVYESGHEVPYYQPKASLELFRRVLADMVVSDGSQKVTPTYESNGTANATHTNTYVTYYTGRPDATGKQAM